MSTTCAEAIREVIRPKEIVSSQDLIERIYRKYPDRPWKVSTIRAHIMGCSVNHSSSHHYPSFPKFLFTIGKGRVRLYNPQTDGKWIVDEKGAHPISQENMESPKVLREEEYVYDEATISLERDLENFLFLKLSALEQSLKSLKEEAGRQYQVNSGRIDILAQDKNESFVVLEIKAGTAKESVLTQLLAYMADVTKEFSTKAVRGIIVAYDFSEKLVAATSLLPTVKLVKYKVNFEFESLN